MTDLMETLYSYARQYTILSFLSLEKEYNDNSRCAEELALADSAAQRAAFQAGFRMAMELTR